MSTRPTILLVDDDPELLRLLSMRVQAAGLNVQTALSGKEALAFITVSRPQAVITDLRMDGMDGMTLFHRIHELDPDLPVIVLTAHGTIPDAVNATRRGVFGFLPKPYDAPELIALIKRAIARFTLDQLSEYIDQISPQGIAARQSEVRRLQAMNPMGANDRLKLAYLLSVESASPEELVQAKAVLEGLEPLFGDPGTRLYVRLLQRTVMRGMARSQDEPRAEDLRAKFRKIRNPEATSEKRKQPRLRSRRQAK